MRRRIPRTNRHDPLLYDQTKPPIAACCEEHAATHSMEDPMKPPLAAYREDPVVTHAMNDLQSIHIYEGR